MPDFVPLKDNVFDGWLANLAQRLGDHCAEVGLTAAEVAPLQARADEYAAARQEAARLQKLLRAATSEKRRTRKAAVETLRGLVRRAVAHPNMTDGLRRLLGLRVPDRVQSTCFVGTETPLLLLQAGHGQITVHFGTSPGNELLNGKPAWAKGCNIYRRKAGETEFRLRDFASSSPYYDTVVGPAAEYSYYARYRGTKPADLGGQSAEAEVAALGVKAG